jgi:hypothetical protein
MANDTAVKQMVPNTSRGKCRILYSTFISSLRSLAIHLCNRAIVKG